jgi:hypothetical protein
MSSIWVHNSISNWTAQSQGSLVCDSEWERAYHIWEHARSLVDAAGNDFSLSDGVSNLKRALNHRLKLIEEMYFFKKIEIPHKPKSYLELLEHFDIVRPYFMRILLNIRNDIEHNDANPPKIERCKELVDVVWYFLKSTDSITQKQTNEALFTLLGENGLETPYWYQVNINFEKAAGLIKINGWFPNTMINNVAQEETSEVILKTLFTKKEKWDEIEKIKKKLDPDILEIYEKLVDTDIWLIGELRPSPCLRLSLIKKLLTCY